jgi:hypothetical protein
MNYIRLALIVSSLASNATAVRMMAGTTAGAQVRGVQRFLFRCGSSAVLRERVAHHLGLVRDDLEIGAARRVRHAATLLPIPQRAKRDAIASARRTIFTCGVRFMRAKCSGVCGWASGSETAAPCFSSGDMASSRAQGPVSRLGASAFFFVIPAFFIGFRFPR